MAAAKTQCLGIALNFLQPGIFLSFPCFLHLCCLLGIFPIGVEQLAFIRAQPGCLRVMASWSQSNYRHEKIPNLTASPSLVMCRV